MYNIHDVKYKVCQACLSSDRKLSLIDESIDIFNIITSATYNACLPIYVCWECVAILKKIKLFKAKVEEAQSLVNHQVNGEKLQISSLSKLSTTFTDTSINITHDENMEAKQEIQETEIKEEIDDELYDTDTNDLYIDEIKTEKTTDKKKKERTKDKNYERVYGAEKHKYLKKKFDINAEDVKNWMNEEKESDFYENFTFKCKLCIQGFNCEEKLKAHVDKYHDELLCPYICTTCNYRLSTNSALCAHMRGHLHAWECTRCGFQCYTRRRLNAHMSAHAVVLCNSCDACLP
ncbi:unnamed protein product [Chrysodeixis includens]|uniref:C2H2-type domain-containing protein n=1 Tax=Chrysodeixis includens TaxID=689277 RepID=A0A9N8KXC2_CHRIL|nr:unnamed protein product [Chrysodeixis includens]